MAAFVLGNGVSRATIDVDRLQDLGPVYGCNALYRTHTVTALVATDRPIATEIQESGYSARNRFYTRRPMANLGAHPVPKPYFGFSSGPIAVAIAAQDHNNPVYLLGFDMGPNEQGQFNNVYADTQHYKKIGSLPTFTGNWVRQLVTVMRDHPQMRFIRVIGATTADIPEFLAQPNFQKLDFTDFVARINTPKDL
jgi:hypothetical protein